MEEKISKELDVIQSLIWARIAEELQKDGVKFEIGSAYGAGSSIKEILHPRVKDLIASIRREERKEYDKRFMDFWNDTDEIKEKEWEIYKKAYGYGYIDCKKGRKPIPHDSRNGYCCACEYDKAQLKEE